MDPLEDVGDAPRIAELAPEDYYDFQVTRPMVELVDGETRQVAWPTTRISWARIPDSGRDVVLIRGIEPNIRWKTFTRDLLDLMPGLGAQTVLLLGPLLADAPHT